MHKYLWMILTTLALTACTSEAARTQITLMIDAEPLVKSQITGVTVNFRSGRIGEDAGSFVARTPQEFAAPLSWPLVVVLVPEGDDPNRAFEIKVSAEGAAGVVVESSARSHFIAGKTLALKMRLRDACRNAVFGSCGDGLTCVVNGGTANCADNEIDPATLPPFVSVDPTSDAGFDSGSDSQVPITREVTGRVFSTNGMAPLSGARVALLSGATAMTNSDGEFSITREATDTALTVDHPDHAEVLKLLPDAVSVYLEIFVMKVDVRQNVSAVTGGTVQAGKGVAATFPTDAFKRPNGTLETGVADVTLSAPDTKDAAQAQAFPGDFKATEAGGKEGSLSAFSAVDLTAKAGNEKLNIADGKEVEVSFPTKEPNATTTADLWSFDTAEQVWKNEGTATLTQDSAGNKIYRAKISHLSWWAVGTLVEDNTCMHLCATYNSAPAAFARATVAGVDQAFQGAFFADDTGCVAFDVPLSTQVSVLVQSIDGVAAPSVFVTGSTLGSSTEPAACQDLGTITLLARVTANAACPSTLVACGGTSCFDLNTDPLRCGACSGSACQLDESCIDGVCACNNSETLCGGACTNLDGDTLNCGSCGVVCATADRCDQGMCVPADCVSPTVSCDGICVDLALDGVNGMCPVAFTCSGGLTDCSGVCADLMTDDNNCGTCGHVCILPGCNAGTCPECTPAACQQSGYNCGRAEFGCGIQVDCGTCSQGLTCSGNVCVPANTCGSNVGECVSGVLMCQGGAPMCVGEVTSMVEVCDGLDNDCDGVIDNGNPGGGVPCGTDIGECVSGTYNCMAGALGCFGGTAAAAELCDGLDNDCDGYFDEGNPGGGAACGSNLGVCVAGTMQCQGGAVTCAGETVGGPEICDGLDNDCDGTVDDTFNLVSDRNNCGACGFVCNPSGAVGACIAGTCAIGTCMSGRVNLDGSSANGCEYVCTPNGNEVCNGIDDDCDGLVDDGVVPPPSFCLSMGVCMGTSPVCQSGGWVCMYMGSYQSTESSCDSLDNDCDGLADPGGLCGGSTAEACNNLDDDLDSMVDDGLMRACGSDAGQCASGTQTCTAGVWGTCTGAISPAAEICDNLDNNCDGMIDGIARSCGNNTGTCQLGTELCSAGVWGGCIGSIGPSTDICDGLDNDCNGVNDNNVMVSDPRLGVSCGLSTGECQAGTTTCVGGSVVCTGSIAASVEVCDALDNDCDTQLDEGSSTGAPCGTSQGECAPGTMTCVSGIVVCQGQITATPELCDSFDNDCDGAVDEAVGGEQCGSDVGECSSGLMACQSGALACQGAITGTPEVSDTLDNDCDGITDEDLISCP